MDIISADIPTFDIIECQCYEKAYLHHDVCTCFFHAHRFLYYLFFKNTKRTQYKNVDELYLCSFADIAACA